MPSELCRAFNLSDFGAKVSYELSQIQAQWITFNIEKS